MLGTEPCDTTIVWVLDLDRLTRLTHQTVPDEVDTVSDVRCAIHLRDLFFMDFLAGNCC